MGFKKRYIIFGLLALEIVSLPVSAHVVHNKVLNFDTSAIMNPPRAINVELNSEPGATRYMVSANTPFTVTSKNVIGTLNVHIYKNGLINGQAYGKNTQSPGAISSCAMTDNTDQRTIYVSERGTIAKKGDILSETILVDISYDPKLTPDIQILTQKKSAKLLPAPLCAKPTTSPAANET